MSTADACPPLICRGCGSVNIIYDTNPKGLRPMRAKDGAVIRCAFGVPQTGEPGAERCADCGCLDIGDGPEVDRITPATPGPNQPAEQAAPSAPDLAEQISRVMRHRPFIDPPVAVSVISDAWRPAWDACRHAHDVTPAEHKPVWWACFEAGRALSSLGDSDGNKHSPTAAERHLFSAKIEAGKAKLNGVLVGEGGDARVELTALCLALDAALTAIRSLRDPTPTTEGAGTAGLATKGEG